MPAPARFRIPAPCLVLALLTAAGGLAGCGVCDSGSRELILATTTSTRDSGLLDHLLPEFEQQAGIRISVVAAGTGKALKLGEAGDADVVLVHARPAEDAFLAAGHADRREDVMYNTFELVGPAEDPAGIKGMKAVEALQRIAGKGQTFVSRGDDSGTHQKEETLWALGGGRPEWPGYMETGGGMGLTLTVTSENQGYSLTDRGTYLAFRDKIDLVCLAEPSPELRNPYGVLVVNPAKHPGLHHEEADALVDFLISPATQRKIRAFQVDGESLFYPLRLPEGD